MQEVYWVEEGVLGGRCGPECVPWTPAELHAGGVRAIVSLDSCGVDSDALQAAGIVHLPLYQPMIFLENTIERRRFLEVVPPVLKFLKEPKQKLPAMVHCHYGRDRTGCVLACCLVARRQWPAEKAITHVRVMQPFALSAPGYAEAVELFEHMVKKRNV
jgi:Polymorphic toxin system, DSP-PTPase phosphatase